ncbi:protein JASON-like [Triticum dicoccoides]|uniref:protein JASON-like n=1 Tax=Triticum dicoccoides TaxID=85692 RepID=UPI00188EC72D|nr:protein JASON-like [Triticum dicoccoides]
MGCLFDCFRAAGGEPRAGRARAQLVSSSVVPNTKVGERRAPPSRNALSAVFLREDEGSQATSSGSDRDAGSNRVDPELVHEEATILKNGGALSETPNEILKGPQSMDSALQYETHSVLRTALSENMNSMEVLKADECQTPSASHQSSYPPDATSSSRNGCDASNQHDTEPVSKSIDSDGVNNEPVLDCGIKLTTLESCSVTSNDDIYLDGSKSSPFSTPLKVNGGMHTPVNTQVPDLEELTYENCTRSCSHDLHEGQNSSQDLGHCGVYREDPCQPDICDEDLKGAKNDSPDLVETSISDECSVFQNSEGSVSSYNKTSDSTSFVEKCQATDVTVHARRNKVITTNSGSDVEFPSLSQWLKPPSSSKAVRDESYTSDTFNSAKSSDEDRPIIGMVAAHWKSEEPDNFTPKWWDGNGIPNSTNKYKEDQKVSWHAMSFEERLEKALSEEKLLSQRKCSTGNTSHFSGVEGEESDTAASNHLRVAAFT